MDVQYLRKQNEEYACKATGTSPNGSMDPPRPDRGELTDEDGG